MSYKCAFIVIVVIIILGIILLLEKNNKEKFSSVAEPISINIPGIDKLFRGRNYVSPDERIQGYTIPYYQNCSFPENE